MAVRGVQQGLIGGVISYFTRHRTAANLFLVIMIVLGLMSATKIRSQFFPDIVIDNVSVSVTWPGAGPEDVDNGIVQLLEPALLSVEGVEESKAFSYEGRARIQLDFEPDYDMARAAEDVKTAVDSVTDLPEDADEPVVRRGAWRDRVTDVVITGPVSTDQLARFADEFVARLFRVGITRTTIRGVAAPETIVEVTQAQLIRNNVSLRSIADVIREEVDADPAGDVAGGSTRVRTGIAKRTADEIGNIAIRSRSDGSKLLISDVAEIRVEGVTRNRSYFVGSNPAISIRVDRADQGDAISMQSIVEEQAAEMELTLPEGVEIRLIRTRAEAITDRLNILLDNGLMGLGLVVLLLFLFLNARTAFWVAAGIPVAMAAAIALMYAWGLTINMISLFALIITLGIVVDDAIVVGEHADFRARRLGESAVGAAENAALRMAAPVFSATVTTVTAFFALTAISGRFGSLIADIPFTVIVVLLASLAECFLILPHHMSHALASINRRRWYDWPSHVFNLGFTWFRETVFRRLIGWVVVFRYPVIALVVVALASQVNLFLKGDVTWRFFNAPERGSITGNFAMVSGATRVDTLEMMTELQRASDELATRYEQEHGRNPVDFVMGEIGGTAGRGLSGQDTKDDDLLGGISIELIDADLRPYTSFEFLAELQNEVRRHPLLETLSFRRVHAGPGGDAIDIQLYGASAEVLKEAALDIQTTLGRHGEVSSLEDNMAYDKEELVLELTPQGQALGFTIDGLGRVLRHRLNGITAATFPVGVRSAEITVQLPEGEKTADFVERSQMLTPDGNYVALSDIVTVTSKTGFASVLRENGLRILKVSGGISEDDPVRAEEITREIKEVLLPRIESEYGVAYRIAGLSEQEDTFLADAQLGLMLALIGIYLTLSWIFSSWTRPIVVMAIIPFGLVGTIWGHNYWDVPLSMFTVVGLIGMTGIIINDSIVLVSTVDEYAGDRDITTAIIDGATDRFRPVLLTTLTTVLGLSPLLFEQSQQAQFLKPTVITLSYGLGFGMFLVLLMVPSLLAMQRDVSQQVQAFRRMLLGRRIKLLGRATLLGTILPMAALFSVTLGSFVLNGSIPPGVLSWLGPFAQLSAGMAALLVFLIGSAVICLLAGTMAGALHVINNRRIRG